MFFEDCAEPVLEFIGHGNHTPRGKVDMDIDQLRGGGEKTLFSVIHAVKVMHAFFIEIEQLRRAVEFSAFEELIVIGNMRFHHERRVIGSVAIVLIDPGFVEKIIRRMVEDQNIIGQIHMPVVVTPFW